MHAIMPHTCMHRRHHKHERTHVPSPSPLFLFGSSTEWDEYLIVCVVDGRRTVEARVIVAAAALHQLHNPEPIAQAHAQFNGEVLAVDLAIDRLRLLV